jgi:hypothetical protein
MLEARESAGKDVNEGVPSRMVGIATTPGQARRRPNATAPNKPSGDVSENVNTERRRGQ